MPLADAALEIARTLSTEVSPPQFLAALLATATAVALTVALVVPQVMRRILKVPIESFLADYLPFDQVLHGNRLIRLSDGTLVATLRIEGCPIGALTREARGELFRRRKVWIDDLAGTRVKVRVLNRRRRRPISARVTAREEDGPTLSLISNTWHESFQETYYTEHTIAFSIAGGDETARAELEEIVDHALKLLHDFSPRVLLHAPPDDMDGADSSELLTFWAAVVNPAQPAPVGLGAVDKLAEHLAGGTFEFDRDTGLLAWSAGPGTECFAHVVAIPRWGDATAEELVGRLLSTQGEITVLHRLTVLSRPMAQLTAKRAGDLALSAYFVANIQDQIDVALGALAPGSSTPMELVVYELVILAFGRTPEEAHQVADEIRKTLVDYQIRATIESDLAIVHYFSQMPGYDTDVRPMRLLSPAVADTVTFESWPRGDDRCDWGEGPVMLLPTEAGTPFSFQFHPKPNKEEAAHTLVIGPTGSGKTTAMTLLATGALARHPKLKVFVFDRDKGCLAWALSLGRSARYVPLQTDLPGVKSASLNPLQIHPLNNETKAHVMRWLRLLIGLNDPDSEEIYRRVIEHLPKLDKHERTLEQIAILFDKKSEAFRNLQPWLDKDGPYGGVFSNVEDSLPIDDARVVVFDMTVALKDEKLAPPLVADLFHRIFAACQRDEAPGLIIVDEAQPMLRNPLFRADFERVVLEARKRRIGVVAMFQRPDALEAIGDPGFAEMVRMQMPSWLLFPNPNAPREAYDAFQMTDREWLAVAGKNPALHHMGRPALLKRPGQRLSQVLDFGYLSLGDLQYCYKSGEEFWRLALKARANQPADQELQFLDSYLSWAGRRPRREESGRAEAPDRLGRRRQVRPA